MMYINKTKVPFSKNISNLEVGKYIIDLKINHTFKNCVSMFESTSENIETLIPKISAISAMYGDDGEIDFEKWFNSPYYSF